MDRYDGKKMAMQLALLWLFIFAQAHFFPFGSEDPLSVQERVLMVITVGLPYLFPAYYIGVLREEEASD
ncbi:hypothetical protein [Aurantiacibacter aquimixticola]|uniref:hypothetical protein n=1 Tax=Aurantiacibacter aquimixticola TaxID=1958945 RepID=UPI001059187D|nr:hypothetical protein [Aurantiacibacter aquimixticola]